MTPPAARRERLVGMLLFGVAVVLLVSSPTWFASDRVAVGIAQIVLGLVLGAVAVWLGRRAQRAL
jgi:NhaP-type Na+/H+ or K+/H+ antiporter